MLSMYIVLHIIYIYLYIYMYIFIIHILLYIIYIYIIHTHTHNVYICMYYLLHYFVNLLYLSKKNEIMKLIN